MYVCIFICFYFLNYLPCINKTDFINIKMNVSHFNIEFVGKTCISI